MLSSNCGIVNPHLLVLGDTLKICGIANVYTPYNVNPPSSFKYYVSVIRCSDYDPPNFILDAPQTVLINGSIGWNALAFSGQFYGNVCFEDAITVPTELAGCDVLFIVGFTTSGSDPSDPNYSVGVSYTLNVERSCV